MANSGEPQDTNESDAILKFYTREGLALAVVLSPKRWIVCFLCCHGAVGYGCRMTAIAKIVVPESNFKQLQMCQSLYINYAFFSRRVSCHQKVISFKLVFQFLTVCAETLHDNRTLFSQQSYVFGFLILTVFGAKMTS